MRLSRITTILAALAAVLIITMSAAVPADAIMLVSRSQEVEIGKEVEKQAIKEYGGLSNDKALSERVRRVGEKVAAVSTRQDVTYTYKVLNSDVINAFACPGGPVLITKKLAQMLDTDEQLAFVLAHETGHVAAQHGRKAINRSMIAGGLASILLGDASDAQKIGVNVMYTLYERGYSRDQEYQADALGVQFMSKAQFNSEGAIMALAKLGLKTTKGVNKYFATHPDTPDRIDRVAQLGGVSDERKQELITRVQSDK